MEAACFETKLIRSVLIEVVILSKLESTYFTSDTSTTDSGEKIEKSIMKIRLIVVAELVVYLVPNQLLFWGENSIYYLRGHSDPPRYQLFSPKVLI